MATLQDLLTQAQGKSAAPASAPSGGSLQDLLAKAKSGTPYPAGYVPPAPSVPKPSIPSVALSSAIGGVKQIGGVFKDDASQILNMFQSSFNQGVSAVNTMTDPKGGDIYTGAMAGLNLAGAVGGVAFSWAAPLVKAIEDYGIKPAANALENTPYIQKTILGAPQNQQDTFDKILNLFAAGGNVAMSILGAKAGPEVKTTEEPLATERTNSTSDSPAAPEPAVPVKSEITPQPIAKESPVSPAKQTSTPPSLPVRESPLPADIPPSEIKASGVPEAGSGKTSGVATAIDSAAIQKGLTEGLSNLAEYTPRVIKEQTAKIANFFTKNPEDIGPIIRSEKAVPNGISPEAFRIAAENHAVLTDDTRLIQDLASSKLTSALSQHGSELRMAGERDAHSPVRAIQEVEHARSAEFAKSSPKIVKSVKTSVRKLNTKETWGSFIKSIEC